MRDQSSAMVDELSNCVTYYLSIPVLASSILVLVPHNNITKGI